MGRYGPFSFLKSRNQGSIANEWVVHLLLCRTCPMDHQVTLLSNWVCATCMINLLFEQLIKHNLAFQFSLFTHTHSIGLIPTFLSFYPFLPILPCLWKAMLLSFRSAFLSALALGYSCSKYCGCQFNGWLFFLSISLVLILLKTVFNSNGLYISVSCRVLLARWSFYKCKCLWSIENKD